MKATTGRAGSDKATEATTLTSTGAEVDGKPLEILPSIAHLQGTSS